MSLILSAAHLVCGEDDAFYVYIGYCLGKNVLQSFGELPKCRICPFEAARELDVSLLPTRKSLITREALTHE